MIPYREWAMAQCLMGAVKWWHIRNWVGISSDGLIAKASKILNRLRYNEDSSILQMLMKLK
jgi:hypothetical protein